MSRRGVAADPAAQARLGRGEKLAEKRLKEDARHVMGSPQGRRFVYWLIDGHMGTFSETFTGSPNQTIHLEGRRSAGVQLMQCVQEWCPRDWSTTLQEALQRRQEEEEQRADAAARASEGED